MSAIVDEINSLSARMGCFEKMLEDLRRRVEEGKKGDLFNRHPELLKEKEFDIAVIYDPSGVTSAWEDRHVSLNYLLHYIDKGYEITSVTVPGKVYK